MKKFFNLVLNKKNSCDFSDVEHYQKEHRNFDLDGGFRTSIGQVDDHFEKSSHAFMHEPYDNHEENHDPKYLDPYYQGSEVNDEIYSEERRKEE